MRITSYYTLSNDPGILTPSINAEYDTDIVKISWTWDPATNNNMSQLEWAWVEDEMAGYYVKNGTPDFNNLFSNQQYQG